MRKRLTKKDRRDEILAAAVHLAKQNGYSSVTRQQIAAHCGVSDNLITHHFKTMPQLRRHIMRAAVRDEVLEIVVEGIILKDPHALKAPDRVKQAAIQLLTQR